jgi:hypothetical protein
MSTDLGLRPTTLPVVAGPENVARARLLVRALTLATPELGLRAQAEKDGPGSKTWEQIADEFGCNISTLDRAREAAAIKSIPRSRNSSAEEFRDLGDEPESF